MLGGGNSGGGIQNDNTQYLNNLEDHLKLQTIWMTKFHFSFYAKNRNS